MAELINLIRPRRVVAIGNDATNSALKLLDASKVVSVRHPSYGGQTIFERQIRSLYDLTSEKVLPYPV